MILVFAGGGADGGTGAGHGAAGLRDWSWRERECGGARWSDGARCDTAGQWGALRQSGGAVDDRGLRTRRNGEDIADCKEQGGTRTMRISLRPGQGGHEGISRNTIVTCRLKVRGKAPVLIGRRVDILTMLKLPCSLSAPLLPSFVPPPLTALALYGLGCWRGRRSRRSGVFQAPRCQCVRWRGRRGRRSRAFQTRLRGRCR